MIETPGPEAGRLGASEISAITTMLRDLPSDLDDAARIDVIRALEVLKCAAEGVQTVVTEQFDRSQRCVAAARGEAKERQGRGVAHQIALARRESPHRGQRHVSLARTLASDFPQTLAALRSGHTTEWKATLIVREAECLSADDRRTVDAEIAGDPTRLEGMGVRELTAAVRRRVCALDPLAVAAKRSKAEADRHVSVRPAPDTMSWLTAHLPVKQGVAVFAALTQEADRLVGAGDGRSRGQIMADTLVARVLGSTASTTGAPDVPVRVNVVIGVDSLLGDSEEPGDIPGHGPIPADVIRRWVADGVAVELRRLFADPHTGHLVGMESQSSDFPRRLAEFVGLRDLQCRTRWCDAPIRHVDHVTAKVDGGLTSADNGQGLCEACNYAKEAIGWQAQPRPGPGHVVETVTPTGHRVRSSAPAAMNRTASPAEVALRDLVLAA